MQPEEKPSLYHRLGGVYSIATVVDDFINRIIVDPKLNANPLVDEAHHRVPPAGFKYLVTEMVCWATGGPQKYTGKSMAESHKDLKITSEEWEAFLDDFQQTLDKFKVPAAEQAGLKAIDHRDAVTDFGLPDGTFFDCAFVHLMTAATLGRLRVLYPEGRFEVRRFRPNIIVETASSRRGQIVAIGDAVSPEHHWPLRPVRDDDAPSGRSPQRRGDTAYGSPAYA